MTPQVLTQDRLLDERQIARELVREQAVDELLAHQPFPAIAEPSANGIERIHLAAPPGKGHGRQHAAARLWQPIVARLLRGLGVVGPLMVGFALPHIVSLAPTLHPVLVFGALLAVGVVGGALLRQRRAVILVPAALLGGLLLRLWAEHAVGPFFGWSSVRLPVLDVVDVLLVAVILLALPLALGAAVGLPLGIWLEDEVGRATHR